MLFWTVLACRTLNVTNDSGSSEPERTEMTAVTLQLKTKPHHWIDGTVQITHSITYDTTRATEPVWNHEWRCDNGVRSSEETLEFTPIAAGEIACTLEIIDTLTEASATSTVITEIHQPPELAKWTVLVYLAADNNLEEAAIIDINEMEQVGSTPDVNVVVEIDRSNRFYSGHEDWSGARRYYVTRDDDNYTDEETSLLNEIVSVELERLGNVDTGKPTTLSNFITWGINTFPSERLAVIFWNHGWSWSLQSTSNASSKGIMSDDSTDNDISIAGGEFEDILSAVYSTRGQHIDVLGLDACIMQSWEVATTAEPFANTFVASQDYVNWDGWAYDQFLAELVANPSMSDLELADTIGFTFWKSGDSTISTVDLTKIAAFNDDLNTLSQELLLHSHSFISQISNQTYSADGANGVDRDLFSLLQHLSNNSESLEIQTKSAVLLEQKDTLIPHNYTGDWIDGATGLSIYAPPFEEDIDETYLNSSWSAISLWDDVLLHDRSFDEPSHEQ